MQMFRSLEPRRQQRVLSVLWTEGSRLLMRYEDCETLLPSGDQAEVIKDALLQHTETERIHTLWALFKARSSVEQARPSYLTPTIIPSHSSPTITSPSPHHHPV